MSDAKAVPAGVNVDERGQTRFTCPRCGRSSYHPEDIRQGYCGSCHQFTGAAELGAVEFDRVVVYDAKDGVRWTYKAAGNSETLADSGEAYAETRDALRAAQRVTGRILTDLTLVKSRPRGETLALVDMTGTTDEETP